jgi:hypothetical protein
MKAIGYILLAFFLFFFDKNSCAQSVRWERTLGAGGASDGAAISQTPDGGYVTAGQLLAGRGGEVTDSVRGGIDVWVVKYSATGQRQWDRRLGGDRDEDNGQVRPTADGGYLVGATSTSGASFDHSQPGRGSLDYWVVKLDAQGHKQWDRTFGTDSLDALTDAWQAADGGYLLLGYSRASLAQGDKSEPSRGGDDFWLVKLDAQGNKLWDRTLGGAGDETPLQGQPTPDGGCILSGSTTSVASGDVSQIGSGPAGNEDYWVVKLDARGAVQWEQRFGGTDPDSGQACVLAPDGGYLVGGISYSGRGGDRSQPSQGGADYWVVKLTATGQLQWDASAGSAADDFINKGLCALAGGGYALVGFTTGGSSGDKSQPSRGNYDIWAVGLSATGAKVWEASYGGNSGDISRSVCATADGGFVALASSSSLISGERTVARRGTGDTWLVKATATGLKQWDQAVGGNTDEVQQALLQAPDGTYWLGGQTQGRESTDKSFNATANFSMPGFWLVQRDSLGNALQDQFFDNFRHYRLRSLAFTADQRLLAAGSISSGSIDWLTSRRNPLDADYVAFVDGAAQLELGGPGDDWLGEARPTPDRGLIFGGTSRSDTGGNKTAASRGGADFWVVKLGRTFAKTWDRAYGGSGLDSLVSVRPTPDGGYLLAGSTTSPADGELTEPGRGGADYWLVKVNSLGAVQWQHRYGGPADDWLAAARPTPDGGCVLLGTTFSGVGGELTEALLGKRDLWVVKVSNTGAVQWQHRYGGSGNDYAATLELDPDGGYVVGASTTSPADGTVSEPSRGSTDYWLLRLSAQGTVLWDQRLGGSGEDLLTCLTPAKGYGYAVGGSSNSPTGSGEHQQANKDGYDYWTLVLGARRVPAPVIASFAPTVGLPGTVVVLTGNFFTGTSSVRFGGVLAPGFVVSNAGTTLSVTLPAGATTGPVTVTANGTGSSSTEFTVPVDLVVSSPRLLQGIYRNITVTGPTTGGAGVGTLTGPLTVLGTLLVQAGGALDTGCQPLTGPGNFTLAAGGELRICDAAGITASGAAGAVQVLGARSFSDDASYTYAGTSAQATGSGLPATVRELTLRNGGGLSLSQSLALRQVLRLSAGDLTRAGATLTLLSGPAGTALVDNAGGNILAGPGQSQQQRYLDPTSNPGPGYRHFASPVPNTPLSQLATSGTAPVLTAAYNTSPSPGQVTPFPTVFGYDQTRLGTGASTLSAFDQGWYVPTEFRLGEGLTVNLAAPALVTFSGDFTNDPAVQVPLGRGAPAEAGWQLLGNPFPAPFDLGAPGATSSDNVGAAAYVFTSSSQYAGTYQAFVNGIGNGPQVLAAGQGFFVRTTTVGQPGFFRFNQAGRVRQFAASPAFQRTAADARPQVQLRLRAGQAPVDAAYVYAQAGATAGFDAAFDAPELRNSGSPSLYTVASAGEALAIQGLPVLTTATQLPLEVETAAPGPLQLEATLLNLPAGLTAYLVDALTGIRQDLAAMPTYALPATGGARGRFSLAFGPTGSPLGTVRPGIGGATLFPNPARGTALLTLPAAALARELLLLDVLGQVVRRQTIPARAATSPLDLAGLASGVYVVRCEAISIRLAVE